MIAPLSALSNGNSRSPRAKARLVEWKPWMPTDQVRGLKAHGVKPGQDAKIAIQSKQTAL